MMQCSRNNSETAVGKIYDLRHDPVIVRMPVASTATFEVGSILKIAAAGGVEAAAQADNDDYYGIALEKIGTAGAGQHASVLVHGTVKPKCLKASDMDEIGDSEIRALRAVGIFAIE